MLRSGGDFRPAHVQWLARQVEGLICLSDVPVPGVQTIPLEYDWPGWWAKLEMFGPSLDGDVLMIDLDTVVFHIPEFDQTTVLRDFTRPDLMGSGLMYVTAEDRARIWSGFTQDPKGHMQRCSAWPRHGDQGFLLDYIGNAQKWQDVARVYSYKQHCRGGLPVDADIVCFHGKPRPWEARDTWIPKMKTDFRDLALKHKGKVVCVMGGGPSIADDLSKIKADIYISTNAHGADLVKPDYLLAMDETNGRTREPMGAYLRSKSDAPIISPHPYADYQLASWPQEPRFVLSGMIGIWAAMLMGAKVIVLAGMDAYGGDAGYINEAVKIARDVHVPVRVASGPLSQVWPLYDEAEKFGRYSAPSQIDGWLNVDGEITVEVLKPTSVRNIERTRGERIRVMRHEVRRLLKHRMLKEV